MAERLTPCTPDLEAGSGFKPRPLRCFLRSTRNFPPLCLSSLRCIKMGTGHILLRGNPAMEASHPGGSSNTPKHTSC